MGDETIGSRFRAPPFSFPVSFLLPHGPQRRTLRLSLVDVPVVLTGLLLSGKAWIAPLSGRPAQASAKGERLAAVPADPDCEPLPDIYGAGSNSFGAVSSSSRKHSMEVGRTGRKRSAAKGQSVPYTQSRRIS
jgi:hypothetical protein